MFSYLETNLTTLYFCNKWKKTLAYLLVLPDRGPGSFDVEDATTLSWSSAAVGDVARHVTEIFVTFY